MPIQNLIKKVEQENNVQVIWAGYLGSKLKGYEVPGSDLDIQLIHIPNEPIIGYLLDKCPKQITIKNDEIDLVSWDLRKALSMFKKSNNKMFEIIQQPAIIDNSMPYYLGKVARDCFNPLAVMNCYAGILSDDLNLKNVPYSDKAGTAKKLIRAIHSILSYKYIEANGTIPPVNLKDLKEVNPILWSMVDVLIDIRKGIYSSAVANSYLTEFYAEIKNVANECKFTKGVNTDLPLQVKDCVDTVFLGIVHSAEFNPTVSHGN